MVERRLNVSHSSLGDVAKCATKSWLSKICGLTTREASAPLMAGSAAHTGAAVWFRTGDATTAYQAFAGEYKAWAQDNVLGDDVRSWENAHEVFWAWVCSLDREKLPYTWEPEEVEVHLEVEWGEMNGYEVTYEGYVDLPVRERVTGARYVLDHKFTGWLKRDTVEGYRLNAQFRGYAWLWEQVRGEKVEGAFANAVEWSRIPKVQTLKSGSEKKCRTHGVPYSECRLHHAQKQLVPMTLVPGDLVEWRASTSELIARLTGRLREYEHADPRDVVSLLPQEGQYSGACGWCEFKRFCMSGRQKGLMETMMVPREPRKGGRGGDE